MMMIALFNDIKYLIFNNVKDADKLKALRGKVAKREGRLKKGEIISIMKQMTNLKYFI